jgi:hypothetical protein
MTESETPDLEAQLRDLDAQIQQLTGESTGMTQQLGGRNDGAQDEEDTAAATTNLEEAARSWPCSTSAGRTCCTSSAATDLGPGR